MEKKDISAVLKLQNNQQKKYKIHYKMSQEDIIHYLMPNDGVNWTYVIEGEDKVVTDFFSTFRLDQTCTN